MEVSKTYKLMLSLLTILIVAVTGDTLVHSYTFPIFPLFFKCLTDTSTHFAIAALSWLFIENVLPKKKQNMTAVFSCGLIASSIDVDHFFTAGSFWLQEATSLPMRPVLHCTTIIVAVFLLLFSISLMRKPSKLFPLSWMILVAGITHHWRDGYRRGIWFCPFSSTPPYPYTVYLVGLILLPLTMAYTMKLSSSLHLVQKSRIVTLNAQLMQL